MTNCPACDAKSTDTGATIRTCRICTHSWIERRKEDYQVVAETTYTAGYAGYRADDKYLAAVDRIVRTEIAPVVPPPASLLDLGCGAGDLMLVARNAGYEVEGLDISEESGSICRERQLPVRVADFVTCEFDHDFDVLTMWDVIAHLHNPAEFVSRAMTNLSPRGVLFIKTPSFGRLSIRISKRRPQLAGVLLGAPSHAQFFTRNSLAALLGRCGYELTWIDGGGAARSPVKGGSLKRRVARKLRAIVSNMSGDGNLYVLAKPSTRH